MKRLLALVLAVLFAFSYFAFADDEDIYGVLVDDGIALNEETIVEYGEYYSTKDEVALYLYAFCELPPNYITKNRAMELGWVSRLGNLWEVAPGFSIGGDRFYNNEGLLPREKGRQYYECDIDFDGGRRNGIRIVFSNDGLIYYTDDHYDSFTLLYEGWYDADAWYPMAA